jgi:type IV secretion system protein TrbL
VASGLGGIARAAGSAAVSPLRRVATRAAGSMRASYAQGAQSAFEATGGASTMGSVGGSAAEAPAAPASDGPPAWARRMKRSQHMTHGVMAAAHAIRSGDSHGGGASVHLSQRDQ